MTTATLPQKPSFDEAYEQSIAKMKWIARRFSDSFGGHPDDLFADLASTFIRVYDRWDPTSPDSAPFLSYLHHSCWRYLTAQNRRNLKRPTTRMVEDTVEAPKSSDFELADFLKHLGPEAREAVSLVLNSSDEVDAAMVDTTPTQKRMIAKRAIVEQTGWGRERTQRVFREIKEALQQC